MNNNLKYILEASGWYEKRVIDIDYYIELLKKENFNLPNEHIQKLMTEYWDLKIEFLINNRHSDIDLNIENAIQNIDPIFVGKFEKIIENKLTPVGLLHFSSAILLVSENSEFWAISNGTLYKIARSFFDFLDVAVHGKEFLRID